MDVTCIVLAGGKSIRLGRNKVAETIGNKSLLERAVCRLAELQTDIIIVSAKESNLPQLTQYPGIRKVTDIYPGKGSLGGVYTGLVNSKTQFNIVVACDMPFLNIKLIHYMLDFAKEFDVVIPRVNDKILEPLHAIYSKNCIPNMRLLIEQDRLSILELFPMMKVRYINSGEIDQFDPQHFSFFNINTENDLKAGKELIGKEDSLNDKC